MRGETLTQCSGNTLYNGINKSNSYNEMLKVKMADSCTFADLRMESGWLLLCSGLIIVIERQREQWSEV